MSVNAMMFPDMSLPPRCRPFLPKRRQRGGRHYANSYGLYPGLRFASPWAVLCRAVGTGSRLISAYSDVEFFSYYKSEGI